MIIATMIASIITLMITSIVALMITRMIAMARLLLHGGFAVSSNLRYVVVFFKIRFVEGFVNTFPFGHQLLFARTFHSFPLHFKGIGLPYTLCYGRYSSNGGNLFVPEIDLYPYGRLSCDVAGCCLILV